MRLVIEGICMSDTIAQHLVQTLIKEGFKRLYCLPGVQNDDFFDAIFDHRETITPIHTRHEQGAAFMALGAAMATGKPQACCVVPGPGILNAGAALATAWGVGAPVLMIVGQTAAANYGKELGELHEIPDQLAILKQFSKLTFRIDDPAQARQQIAEAMTALKIGRSKPVSIEVPVDLWNQSVSNVLPEVKIAEVPTATQSEIRIVAEKITESQKPMIITGEGSQGLGKEILDLAKTISSPVISNEVAQKIVDASSSLSVSSAVGRELWTETDLVIGLGCRLGSQLSKWVTNPKIQSIHIDNDPEEFNRGIQSNSQVYTNLAKAVPLLTDSLGRQPDRNSWEKTVQQTKNLIETKINLELAPQAEYLNAIRTALPDNGVLVVDLTQVGYAAAMLYKPHLPRTFLSSGFQGTLGWSIPAGLGASDALPDVPVVVVCGDGGAMYNIQELATAKLHQIPITVIVFNDASYGNVRRFQIEKYGNRIIATDLYNPDFHDLAKSFGVHSYRIKGPEELADCLSHSIDSGKPSLISIDVGEFPSPWPFI